LKKRSKKLLLIWAWGVGFGYAPFQIQQAASMNNKISLTRRQAASAGLGLTAAAFCVPATAKQRVSL
jgi:hypothetical protein